MMLRSRCFFGKQAGDDAMMNESVSQLALQLGTGTEKNDVAGKATTIVATTS